MKSFNIEDKFYDKIITNEMIHRRDFRILFLLMKKSVKVDEDIIAIITQKQISLILKCDTALISKSINRLIECGLIERVKSDKRIDFAKGFKINF